MHCLTFTCGAEDLNDIEIMGFAEKRSNIISLNSQIYKVWLAGSIMGERKLHGL